MPISSHPELPMRPAIIYSKGDRYRYRQYPFWTRTSIPGAGFKRRLVWAQQPLMLSGLSGGYNYSAHHSPDGLGVTASQVTSTVSTAAGLLSDPDAYLRARGPQLVAALDRHVIGPIMDASIRRSTPYIVKYIVPPIALLYVISGMAAWFAYKSWKK